MSTAKSTTTPIHRSIWPRATRFVHFSPHFLLSCAAVALLFAMAAVPSHAQTSSPLSPQVTWHDGRLNLRVENAPLHEVLQKIGRLTGMQLLDAEKVRGQVTATLVGVSLPDALKTILVEWDYAFTEGGPGSRDPVPRLLILEPSLAGQKAATAGVASAHPHAAIPGRAALMNSQEDGSTDNAEQEKKIAALHAAGAKGDLKALQLAIADSDPDVQKAAFDQLTTLDPKGAVEALVAATGNAEPNIAIQSLALLSQSEAERDTILNALGAQVDSKDVAVKTYAVQSLTEFGPEALDFLTQAYADADASIRLAVIQSVARKDWGVPLLQEATGDADEQVRFMAQRLLQQVSPQTPEQPQPQPQEQEQEQEQDPPPDQQQ